MYLCPVQFSMGRRGSRGIEDFVRFGVYNKEGA